MDTKEWTDLITLRTDLSDRLIHLTKSNGRKKAITILFEIFESGTLIANTNKTSTVNKIVCFQDTPITAIAQMSYIWKNKTLFPNTNKEKTDEYIEKLKRYEGFGIRISKRKAYKKGVRPAFYLNKNENSNNEQISSEYGWKTISFDLDNEKHIIDWSHEREWIYFNNNNNYKLNYKDLEIIVPTQEDRKLFIQRCLKSDKTIKLLKQIKGILVLESILN